MPSFQVEELSESDILVCGAGTAGCCAAIAASQRGARVTLVDRGGFLGGTSTAVLDTFYGFFTPGTTPRKVAGGIPDEVVDRLDQFGSIFLRPNTYGAGTGVTYDPERLKLVWDQMMVEAGVTVLHHSQIVDVIHSSSGQISGVVAATRDGLRAIRAPRLIDATGDAEVCHYGGIPYEKAGQLEPAQTMTTTFRMAGVDLDAFRKAGGKAMMHQKMEEAVAQGRHDLPRRSGSFHEMVWPGMVATVAVRVAGFDPMDPFQMSEAEREGRRQCYVFEKFVREEIPGYENAKIVGLSSTIGVRESRRVYGEYRLTRDDCLSARKPSDSVLLCGAPIEDHRPGTDGEPETAWAYIPKGAAYGVPYGCLVPRDSNELWVAGRCFSATHDAHASCRSMAQTMSMGQAAGVAAALAHEEDLGAREVPIGELLERLQAMGAILEAPDQQACTGSDEWRLNRRGHL